MLFVNGELRIIYINADKSVIKKVEDVFLQAGYRYDFEHTSLKHGVKINAWGNDSYTESHLRELLESLKSIVPVEEGSEFDFNDGDGEYWRYLFRGGNWKYQMGKLAYEDSEVE